MKDLVLVKQPLPKNLTELEKGKIVHKCVTELRVAMHEIETNWLKLGAIWSFLTKNKLWSAYGSHIKNASDFLREIDLGVTRRSLEYYASIIDSKIGDYLVTNNLVIPVTKLRTIAHVAKESGDIEGWINKCALPIRALEDAVKEYKGMPTTDTCLHPANKQIRYTRCEICNKWLKL